MSDKPFHRLRRDTRWLAAFVTILCLLLFSAITPFAPLAPGEPPTDGWRFSAGWYQAAQALITAVLGVGLLSLLFELFLREAHGRDLADYLRLRTAMLTSGVDSVTNESEFDWADFLRGSRSVKVLLRDASSWLPAQQQALMQLARTEQLELTVAVPDEDGSAITVIAASLGYSSADFKQQTAMSRQLLERSWTSNEPGLKPGTKFRIVSYNAVPAYEIVVTDQRVAVLLGPALTGAAVGSRMVSSFHPRASETYPASWLRLQVDALENLTSTWEREAQ